MAKIDKHVTPHVFRHTFGAVATSLGYSELIIKALIGHSKRGATQLYAHVPARWGAWIFSDDVRTRLVPAAYGDASGVRGAAWLWGRDVERVC